MGKAEEERLGVGVGQRLALTGTAYIRTGDRRSVAAARRIAKLGAAEAGVEVKTSAKDGHLFVSVK